MSSKIPSNSESLEKSHRICRRRRSSSNQIRWKSPVSKGSYSISETELEKSAKRDSNCTRHSIDRRCHRSRHSLRQSKTVIQAVNANYWAALDYCSYCLSHRSQHHNDDRVNQIVRMAQRLEVHLKSQMLDGSDSIIIFGFLPTFQMSCDTKGITEVAQYGYSTFL